MNLLDVMKAVAAFEREITISTPASMKTVKAFVSSPPPREAISNYPTFLNVFEPAETESGIDMRITRGTVRMQCLIAKAEPGDEPTQEKTLAFWQATYDAVCRAVQMNRTLSVGIRIGGSDVPAFLERGGELYIGFEIRLAINVTEGFQWS